MKKNFVKYLLWILLAVYPFVLAVSACKDEGGTTDSFANYSESISENLSEGETEYPWDSSIEDSIHESSSLESVEEEDSTSESSIVEDDTEESVEDNEDDADKDAPKDELEEGGLITETHHFVTASAEPDCTTTGFYKKWCDKCEVVVEEYTIPALGHTYVTIEGYSSTCKTAGCTEKTFCSVCGEVFVESQDLPLADHAFTLGLGSCIWCDLSAPLRYEIRYKEDIEARKFYYAVCLGATEFSPYTVTRFLEIPDTVTLIDDSGYVYENRPVLEIADYAFFGAYDVNTLVIGANVEKIGNRAFADCYNLREVYDKSGLHVGDLQESKNGEITRWVVAEDIHYTEDYISKVSVDEESGCILYTNGSFVELVGIRDTTDHVIIPEGVTKISSYVFYKTRVIKTLTIAKSVEEIAKFAFSYPCDKHNEEGHNNEKCKFQLKKIIFLNPKGWRAYEYVEQNHKPFLAAELNELPTGAWTKLAMEYLDHYWVRSDQIIIPTV